MSTPVNNVMLFPSRMKQATLTRATENYYRNKYPTGCGVGMSATADGCGFQRCPTCARNVNRDKWRQ